MSGTPFAASAPKRYRITWKHNRSHGLQLGQARIDFAPHGSQVVGADVIAHAEFQNQREDFVVEEA